MKFFCSSILFLFISLLAYQVFVRNFRFRLFHVSQTKLVYNNFILDKKSIEYENIILGDSVATFAIDTNSLQKRFNKGPSINLSQLGGSPTEALILLKRYLSRTKAPKNLFMLYSFNDEIHKTNSFWKVFVRNGFYSVKDFHEVLNRSHKVNSFPSTNPHLLLWLKYVQHRLYLDQDAIVSIQKWMTLPSAKRIQYSENSNKGQLEQFIENKGSALLQSMNDKDEPLMNYVKASNEFKPSTLYTDSFKKIITLAEKNNIRVYLILPPVTKLTLNKFKKYYDSLKLFLNSFKGKNTWVLNINPVVDDQEFLYFNHLRASGSFIFSKRVGDAAKTLLVE